MEVLETLFSSRPRVKVIRNFLFQPNEKFPARDIAERTDVAVSTARTHARDLASIDFLKEGETESANGGKNKTAWYLNKNSTLRKPLHDLIIQHQEFSIEDAGEELRKVGDFSIVVLSGVFVGSDDRPVDILLAGEEVDKNKLDRSLAKIEQALGTELRYTLLSEEEFRYRQNVYDKLVRDVLDYPHHTIVDTMNATAATR